MTYYKFRRAMLDRFEFDDEDMKEDEAFFRTQYINFKNFTALYPMNADEYFNEVYEGETQETSLIWLKQHETE